MSYNRPEVWQLDEDEWLELIRTEKSHRLNYSNGTYWAERDRLEAERESKV